jgi:hypothetical protein
MKLSDFESQIRQYENKPMSREHLRRLVTWAVHKERADCAFEVLSTDEEAFSCAQASSILATRGETEDI